MAKKKKRKSVLSLLNLKISARDRRLINAMAHEYAGGNLSAWLRFAGEEFKPTQKQRKLLNRLVKTKSRVGFKVT